MTSPFPDAQRSARLMALLAVLALLALSAQAADPLWAARYNGPGNWRDVGKLIAVDDSGSIYVTGQSYGGATNYDYATIKYSPAGTQLWVARYNSPWSGNDNPTATALDRLGNLYVTGASAGTTGVYDYDYATVKYRCATGEQAWAARYDGRGEPRSWDAPYGIALDSAANVYVTGRIDDSNPTMADYDIATVKYDSSGNERWVARFTGGLCTIGYAIAVDRLRNVYVTGHYETLGMDGAITIKYDSAGNQLWRHTRDSCANVLIALDRAGYIYVAGHGVGYTLAKYDPAGTVCWATIYPGPGGDDMLHGMVIDDSANIYLTGMSYRQGTSYDFRTIKCDSAGNLLWEARYDGPAHRDDGGNALATDGKDVCVVGYCASSPPDSFPVEYDVCVVMYYCRTGQEQWVSIYRAPGTTAGTARAAAMTRHGFAYATGYSSGDSSSFSDFLTLKYDPGGSGAVESPPIPSASILSLMPSPAAAGHVVLRYSLPAPERVRIAIIDASGRKVISLALPQSAECAVPLDLRHLASGVYSVRLEAGRYRAASKLVLCP